VKKGVIFDLDGVLVDSMPSHVKAWRESFSKIAGLNITEREIYALEGMRGKELIKKIFSENGILDSSLVTRVSEEKDKIFRQMKRVSAFEGARKLADQLQCAKAVVSGSSKRDVMSILDGSLGHEQFDVIITADDIEKGKPDPGSFLEAATKMEVTAENAVVIENAPLGAQAANNAGMRCYIVLNNTPLLRSDFDGIVPDDRIFETTSSLGAVLAQWCK
jgi:HAD superfamily hydrolase (TIGR01509 family)